MSYDFTVIIKRSVGFFITSTECTADTFLLNRVFPSIFKPPFLIAFMCKGLPTNVTLFFLDNVQEEVGIVLIPSKYQLVDYERKLAKQIIGEEFPEDEVHNLLRVNYAIVNWLK